MKSRLLPGVVAVVVAAGVLLLGFSCAKPRPGPGQQDREAAVDFLDEYMGGRDVAVKEYGSPDAPVHIAAWVHASDDHRKMIDHIRKRFDENPKIIYFKLIKLHSSEGRDLLREEGKEQCARYEINGSNTCTIKLPDGGTKEVEFYKGPAYGYYEVEGLFMAVDQAIAEATGGTAPGETSTSREGEAN